MRAVFLIIILIGAAAGIAYPWAIQNFSGRQIGTWQVFARGSGFVPVQATLDSSDAPVRILVDLTSVGTPTLTGAETELTITASVAGRTVLAETLDFVNAVPRTESPQSGEQIYRDEAGTLHKLDTGDYTFKVGPGDADGIDMKSVQLILRAGAGEYDQRAQPAGFTLMAVGFIGFVLTFRRGGNRPQNPNSQPPGPRWGRGGGRGA